MILASSQGGINIEEVAKEAPETIVTEPVDINQGLKVEAAQRVARAIGFEGPILDQVNMQYIQYILF